MKLSRDFGGEIKNFKTAQAAWRLAKSVRITTLYKREGIYLQLFPAKSSEFWINLWDDAQRHSPMRKRRRRTETEMIEMWNSRAKQFAKNTNKNDGQERRQRVLGFLEQGGALQKGFKVLDIGAGPGNFAIPMAHIASHVTALEPASEMVKILQARATAEQLENISIMQRTWQEVDVEEEGLVGQFDLVFASMTPGVQDPETLEKMIRASRGYCYLSGFSGQRWCGAYNELWRLFYDEDIGDTPSDVIYPFGLLYSMGYRPNLRFTTHKWVDEYPIEEATDNFLKFFENYMDISAGARKTIEDYVLKHAENGIFRLKANGYSEMMLWRVKEANTDD
jgi:2-polyprenyl-3-methyl-5-hydroxy-6-metoxy-1,4-benzoquinol methylase